MTAFYFGKGPKLHIGALKGIIQENAMIPDPSGSPEPIPLKEEMKAEEVGMKAEEAGMKEAYFFGGPLHGQTRHLYELPDIRKVFTQPSTGATRPEDMHCHQYRHEGNGFYRHITDSKIDLIAKWIAKAAIRDMVQRGWIGYDERDLLNIEDRITFAIQEGERLGMCKVLGLKETATQMEVNDVLKQYGFEVGKP